jgi:hypothetical protein
MEFSFFFSSFETRSESDKSLSVSIPKFHLLDKNANCVSLQRRLQSSAVSSLINIYEDKLLLIRRLIMQSPTLRMLVSTLFKT